MVNFIKLRWCLNYRTSADLFMGHVWVSLINAPDNDAEQVWMIYFVMDLACAA